jgi:tetratricopeptide (TPR) repeat protein
MNLASNLENAGQFEEAERIEREVLELQQRVLPTDHPNTLYTLNALGNTLYRMGRVDEAERVMIDCAQRMDRVYGPNAFEPLVVQGSVAYLLRERGKLDEAAERFQQIISRASRSMGDDNIATLRARSILASTLCMQGKLDAAEAIYRAEIPRWRRVRGEVHPETLVQLRGLGETLEQANRLADAEPVYAELFTAAARAQDDPAQVARNMAPLGLTRARLGRLAEAEAPLRAALLKLIEANDSATPRTAQVYEALIEVCEKTGRPEEAERLRKELARIRSAPTTAPANETGP